MRGLSVTFNLILDDVPSKNVRGSDLMLDIGYGADAGAATVLRPGNKLCM